MRAKARLIKAIRAILLIVALAVPLVRAPAVLAISCYLTVISDGCCPITVDWWGGSDNITAGGNRTFDSSSSCLEYFTLTANNSTCCEFDHWEVNRGGSVTNISTPVVQIYLNQSRIVATAHCRHLLSSHLTVISDGCCPITVDWGGGSDNVPAGVTENFTMLCGTNVTLTANNSTCCEFDHWRIVGTGLDMNTSANPFRITMTGPGITLTAYCTYICIPPVGAEAYPVSKASLLTPWIAVGVILAGGAIWYVLRRRRIQS